MKIIEAMRKIKINLAKIEENKVLIAKHASDYDNMNPVYGTFDSQIAQITSWVQQCHDWIEEIEVLKAKISATNAATNVTIQIGDNNITKSITRWINRRDSLAKLELSVWECLNDGGRKDSPLQNNVTKEIIIAHVRRYYDQATKDKKCSTFRSEHLLIDGALEIVNATTELI